LAKAIQHQMANASHGKRLETNVTAGPIRVAEVPHSMSLDASPPACDACSARTPPSTTACRGGADGASMALFVPGELPRAVAVSSAGQLYISRRSESKCKSLRFIEQHFGAERAKLTCEDHASAMLLASAQAVEYDDCLNDHEDGLEHLASHCRGEDADDLLDQIDLLSPA
jgi:hypothetical protein